MFSAIGRRGVARITTAIVVSGLVAAGAVAGAGAAAADDAPSQQLGGAAATIDGLKTYDSAVIHGDGGDRKVSAGLFEMTVSGGGKLSTYCIDIGHPTKDQASYLETPWAQTSLGSNGDAGKIRWILQNSYPQVNDLAKLAQEAGTGELSEKTAAAGTQVAIWRYSDHVKVDAVDKQAELLADWLTDHAANVAEPKASLTLDQTAVSGKVGEKLGPITVHTDADSVTVAQGAGLADSGVKIVDAAGKPVTAPVGNGAKLFFDVPADAQPGSGSLTVQATTQVPVGRAFASSTGSQTQILAGSSESTVSASATATWAKQGAIPAVSAQKNCAKGGVDITAANTGDEDFTFELAGKSYTIGAGKSQTVTIPVAEDQAYDFTITGPGGFKKEFQGVLDCKTAATGGSTPTPQPSAASVGGASTGGTDTNLAETGSSSATPMIAGIAIALVVLGGGAVFFLRRKKSAGNAQ
ncbi:LAETG motif-containing sortase-dependent surface protein [Streptomyces sp. NBC_01465]|uniref:LAETG motif-containing sortase-dependent surface protein n=1 Tax=Streptomyces sp. NBC_01465 TaxID=2903878 RepID=UPI002E343F86|nr:LAETG motif-containing sortase-dependent surface protein [Streptomyces sp. NBC_01465]